MRIGIDSRPLRERQTSGIPRYVNRVLHALAKIDNKNEYILYAHKDFSFDLPNSRWKKRTGALTRYGSVWMQLELPFWIKEDKVDIFWGTQHVLPIFLPKNVKAVLTMLDLVHLVFPKTMKWLNLIINKYLIPPSVKRADAIVTISQWTKNDVIHFLKPQNKIWEVTYLGVDPHFVPGVKSESKAMVQKWFQAGPDYLLTVGTFEPRKNLTGLLNAFKNIAKTIPHDLVVVGQKGWKSDAVLKEMVFGDLAHRIKLIGYVDDEKLIHLYRGADVFIFPTFYEGFGLPPLEAMACGSAVVTSDVSSLPEVVGHAACLVNPHNPDDIAGGILKVLNNPSYSLELTKSGVERAKEFKWETTAQKMLDLFNRFENS